MRLAWLATGITAGLALTAASSPQTLAAGGAPPPETPVDAAAGMSQAAPLFEPYRFNARERTARALAAWGKGRPEDAVPPLDSALRLQPGDSLIEYNAGTAHLGANQPDAARLLEQAAKHAPSGLAADAFYNLGNARLGAQDAAGAIEAYKNALRTRSDLANAKRNLELALRMLEEQQKQQEKQQRDQQAKNQQGKNQQSQNQQQAGGQDQNQQSQNPEPAQQKADSSQKPPQPGEGDPQQGGQQAPPLDRPLPQFQDQKDMTAEQAAAILQAVENLERQQRRDQARARARAKTSVEKDW